MPVPVLTFGLVCLRAGLRPINSTLTKAFKTSNIHPIGFKFFAAIGHSSHKGEMYLKQKLGTGDEQG